MEPQDYDKLRQTLQSYFDQVEAGRVDSKTTTNEAMYQILRMLDQTYDNILMSDSSKIEELSEENYIQMEKLELTIFN